MLHVAYIIQNVACLKKFLRLFTMNWTMNWNIGLNNGLNYYRGPSKNFGRALSCVAENTEKYKTFSVQITKKNKWIGKNREEITKAIP